MNDLRFALALSFTLFASAFAATAHADAFLKIDGITGESTDATHKDEIVVDSFTFGAAASTSASTGAATGVSKFDSLTFTHQIDRASAPLLLAVAQGQAFKTAVLSARKAGSPNEYLKVTLSNAIITSVKIAGTRDEPAREEVTVRFTKILFEYFIVQRDGKVAPGSRMGWDVTSSKAL